MSVGRQCRDGLRMATKIFELATWVMVAGHAMLRWVAHSHIGSRRWRSVRPIRSGPTHYESPATLTIHNPMLAIPINPQALGVGIGLKPTFFSTRHPTQ